MFDDSEIECLFGTLSFEETNLRKLFENTQRRRPKTDVPRLRVSELLFKTDSLTHHLEVSKTEREIRKRPNSRSFEIVKNRIRREMGIREIQSPLKEFKSSEYFLFHIAYDEQSSYLYISGYSPKIYTLQNV